MPIGLNYQGLFECLYITGLRGSIKECGGLVLPPPGESVGLLCSQISPTERIRRLKAEGQIPDGRDNRHLPKGGSWGDDGRFRAARAIDKHSAFNVMQYF